MTDPAAPSTAQDTHSHSRGCDWLGCPEHNPQGMNPEAVEAEFDEWWSTLDASHKNGYMRKFSLATWQECRTRLLPSIATLQRELAEARADYAECWQVGQDAGSVIERQARELEAARAENERLRTLLERIYKWDHMDGAADGPYWRREIDAALGRDKRA